MEKIDQVRGEGEKRSTAIRKSIAREKIRPKKKKKLCDNKSWGGGPSHGELKKKKGGSLNPSALVGT